MDDLITRIGADAAANPGFVALAAQLGAVMVLIGAITVVWLFAGCVVDAVIDGCDRYIARRTNHPSTYELIHVTDREQQP